MHDNIVHSSTVREASQLVMCSRLAAAIAISIGLHAGVLALPPGGTGWRPADQSPSQGGSLTAAAPLSVRLAPFRLQPASTLAPPPGQHVVHAAPPVRLSPAVADDGRHDDGLAGQGAGQQRERAATAGVPLQAYYDTEELTHPATMLEEVDFSLPELDSTAGAGKAILVLYINETGRVDRVEVEAAGELDPTLVNALVRQVGKALFQPAQIDGAPVRSRMRGEILLRPLMKRN